jgi:hypothetical protein
VELGFNPRFVRDARSIFKLAQRVKANSAHYRTVSGSERVKLAAEGSLGRYASFCNGFNPRDFQNNLASASFGAFYNGVGRMFALKFVIEKK